jgi:hypothetical protein
MTQTEQFEKLVEEHGLKGAMGVWMQDLADKKEPFTAATTIMFCIALAGKLEAAEALVQQNAKTIIDLTDHVLGGGSGQAAGQAAAAAASEDADEGQGRPQDSTPFPSGLSTSAAPGQAPVPGGMVVGATPTAPAVSTASAEPTIPSPVVSGIPKPDVVGQVATNVRKNGAPKEA